MIQHSPETQAKTAGGHKNKRVRCICRDEISEKLLNLAMRVLQNDVYLSKHLCRTSAALIGGKRRCVV